MSAIVSRVWRWSARSRCLFAGNLLGRQPAWPRRLTRHFTPEEPLFFFLPWSPGPTKHGKGPRFSGAAPSLSSSIANAQFLSYLLRRLDPDANRRHRGRLPRRLTNFFLVALLPPVHAPDRPHVVGRGSLNRPQGRRRLCALPQGQDQVRLRKWPRALQELRKGHARVLSALGEHGSPSRPEPCSPRKHAAPSARQPPGLRRRRL